MIIDDMLEELSGPVLERSSLYRLLQKFKPEIVVDCVNSATAIAYQDIFQSSRRVLKEAKSLRTSRKPKTEKLVELTEQLICTLYVPQLIRHVQLMYRSMQIAGTKIYRQDRDQRHGRHGSQHSVHPQRRTSFARPSLKIRRRRSAHASALSHGTHARCTDHERDQAHGSDRLEIDRVWRHHQTRARDPARGLPGRAMR